MDGESSTEAKAAQEREQLCAALEHKRRVAGRLAKRGVAVAISGPFSAIVLMIVADYFHGPLIATLGLFYAWVVIVGGGVYATGNELARRSAERQLRALDEHRRLPEARVVIR